MNLYTGLIIRHRKLIVAVFLIAALMSAALYLGVEVNYNMVDYLPSTAQSTTAVELMADEFTQAVPNASVLVHDVSIVEAQAVKRELSELTGVKEVLWLDDMIDVKQPLSTHDTDTVEGFYKNGHALFSVTVLEGMEGEAARAIRDYIGEDNALSGEASDTAAMQNAASSEVMNAVLILVPSILLILILSSNAWIEPVFFIAAIGVSILINMGTNIFLGKVSYITNSVSPILQLAVSLDYAIFLLHSFGDYRKETNDPEEAMRLAMGKSVKTVAASAVTTLFGFVALAFMDFGIGADLGLNLAKGIALSFLSCMVFLPALTLCFVNVIDKTRHRELLPSFRNVNRFFSKLAIPVLLLVIILVVPSFLGQNKVEFTYGNGAGDPSARHERDRLMIEEEFGNSTVFALLVPRGDIVKEYEVGRALKALDHVTGVMSFAETVGTGIPAEFLDTGIIEQFYSENFARIIVYADTPAEGEIAFAAVDAINATVSECYDGGFYTAGQSANLYDMKNVVETDVLRVNLIAIVSIFAVLLVTFRSATLPFLLLLTIEVGIWINLAIPYFMGESINFLGYLVISTVQLGATVDYAILLTSYYLDNRKLMGQKEAIHKSLGETFKSILMSGATLTLAGFTLGLTSSNPIVAGLGLLLGRGTLFSMGMVFCLLPALLKVFDRLIGVTTYKANLFIEPKNNSRLPAQEDRSIGNES